MKNEKIYNMSFSRIYPLLVNKAEKKDRTLNEVIQVITWLTGYNADEIEKAASSSLTYGDFFRNASDYYVMGPAVGMCLHCRVDPGRVQLIRKSESNCDIWIRPVLGPPYRSKGHGAEQVAVYK